MASGDGPHVPAAARRPRTATTAMRHHRPPAAIGLVPPPADTLDGYPHHSASCHHRPRATTRGHPHHPRILAPFVLVPTSYERALPESDLQIYGLHFGAASIIHHHSFPPCREPSTHLLVSHGIGLFPINADLLLPPPPLQNLSNLKTHSAPGLRWQHHQSSIDR